MINYNHSIVSRRRDTMFASQCTDCTQTFSRRDNMLRHHGLKHGQGDTINGAYPPPPPPPPPSHEEVRRPPPPTEAHRENSNEEKNTMLQHPFTMMICGPTGISFN